MKYSKHCVNVRTIRAMDVGEILLLKHGKRIEYKGGYTIARNGGVTSTNFNAAEIMKIAKQWRETADKYKTTVIAIKRVNEENYHITFAEHYSNKSSFSYQYHTKTLNHKPLEF